MQKAVGKGPGRGRRSHADRRSEWLKSRRGKNPATHLTYPGDIFVLGLFDHGNESGPGNAERGDSPHLGRFQPHGPSGIRGDGRGLSRGSSSAPRTCRPQTTALTEPGVCRRDQASRRAEQKPWPQFVSSRGEKKRRERSRAHMRVIRQSLFLLTARSDPMD